MLLFLRRVAPHSCLGEIKLQRGAKTGSWTQPYLNLGYTCQLFLHLEETLILISIKGTFVINLESCCENIYNPVLLVMSQHPFIERKVSEASWWTFQLWNTKIPLEFIHNKIYRKTLILVYPLGEMWHLGIDSRNIAGTSHPPGDEADNGPSSGKCLADEGTSSVSRASVLPHLASSADLALAQAEPVPTSSPLSVQSAFQPVVAVVVLHKW